MSRSEDANLTLLESARLECFVGKRKIRADLEIGFCRP
jgi:hypothetical protein